MMKRDKKDKKDLIPFEKSKRVIYLEKRGRNSKDAGGKNISSTLLAICGVLFVLYCAGVFLVGYGTYFFLIWGALGLGCLVLSCFLRHPEWLVKVPKWLRRIFVSIVCVGLVIFCVVEGMILSQFNASPQGGADFCIILGAQWKTTGPSDVLRRRLDAAVEYLVENPETDVIVTGGQGANEMITEGAGMREYLLDAGIADDRIIVEDKATNTYENLVFSADYIDKEEDTVVLVTNNFHVYRAVKIAEKQGFEKVSGLAADSVAGLLPNNLLREFLGVIKDFLVGNL